MCTTVRLPTTQLNRKLIALIASRTTVVGIFCVIGLRSVFSILCNIFRGVFCQSSAHVIN